MLHFSLQIFLSSLVRKVMVSKERITSGWYGYEYQCRSEAPRNFFTTYWNIWEIWGFSRAPFHNFELQDMVQENYCAKSQNFPSVAYLSAPFNILYFSFCLHFSMIKKFNLLLNWERSSKYTFSVIIKYISVTIFVTNCLQGYIFCMKKSSPPSVISNFLPPLFPYPFPFPNYPFYEIRLFSPNFILPPPWEGCWIYTPDCLWNVSLSRFLKMSFLEAFLGTFCRYS